MNLDKTSYNFHKDGYVVVRSLFNRKNINEIKKDIKKIKKLSVKINNKHVHFTKDKKINTIHNINTYKKSGKIINLSRSKKLLKIVSYLLQSSVSVRNIEFFSKPKKTGMRAPYHQDNFYWKFDDKQALNVWIACNKSGKKNGGLNYFIGSHKQGLRKHVTSFEPGSSYKIPNSIIAKLKSKKFFPELGVGDVLIHHCEVIHGSNKNTSNSNREGLVISYKSKNSKPNLNKLRKYSKNVAKNLNFLNRKNKK